MSDNIHERLSDHSTVQPGSDRSFGLIVGGIITLFGVWRWLFSDHGFDMIVLALLALGAGLVALGALQPSRLRLANRYWTKLGLLMGRIMTPVVMLVIFTIAVLPVGLLRRAFAGDTLGVRFDPAAPSYWIERTPPGPPPETMTRQF